jgi:outer membrane protein OmpA-like peptidoglycan-associated protein
MKNIKSYSDLVNESLNEDNIGSAYTRQDQLTFTPGSTTILDGSLFKLGKDQIDTSNSQFKKAVDLLKPLGTPIITIQGGASAVGNDKGFDNAGLAKRRAENFVRALKAAGVDTSLYVTKFGVGTATVPNSAEANAEQFVKIIYTKEPRGQYIAAIDNATVKKQIIPINKVVPPVVADRDFLILKVFYDKDTKDKVMSTIVNSTKPLKSVVRDVTSAYNNKKYSL